MCSKPSCIRLTVLTQCPSNIPDPFSMYVTQGRQENNLGRPQDWKLSPSDRAHLLGLVITASHTQSRKPLVGIRRVATPLNVPRENSDHGLPTSARGGTFC